MAVRDDTLTADKRASTRVTLSAPGLLRLPGGDVKVIVRNISAEGAMIDGASDIALGRRVSVCIWGVGWVDATVAWVIAPRCGLAFRSPINPKAAFAKP